jgi:hypothetical protein
MVGPQWRVWCSTHTQQHPCPLSPRCLSSWPLCLSESTQRHAVVGRGLWRRHLKWGMLLSYLNCMIWDLIYRWRRSCRDLIYRYSFQPLARLGATVTGIDASAENIGMAKWHATLDPAVHRNTNYICSPVEHLPSSMHSMFWWSRRFGDFGTRFWSRCLPLILLHINQSEFP